MTNDTSLESSYALLPESAKIIIKMFAKKDRKMRNYTFLKSPHENVKSGKRKEKRRGGKIHNKRFSVLKICCFPCCIILLLKEDHFSSKAVGSFDK